MGVVRRVKVTEPRLCSKCGKEIKLVAVKVHKKGKPIEYFHTKDCYRNG